VSTIHNKLTHFEFIFKPTIGFDITVPGSGPYVLMVTYLHPERFIQRVFVTVGHQRGMLEILPCKYQFACRQFAMDDNKRPRAFELKATPEVNEVKIESSASAKIAVVSIHTIDHIRILGIRLKLACNGGSCGRISLASVAS